MKREPTNPTPTVTTPLRRLRHFLADAVTAAERQPTPCLRGYPFTER